MKCLKCRTEYNSNFCPNCGTSHSNVATHRKAHIVFIVFISVSCVLVSILLIMLGAIMQKNNLISVLDFSNSGNIAAQNVSDSEQVQIDKGLFDVTVTLPASFFDTLSGFGTEMTAQEYVESAQNNSSISWRDVTYNSDGSVSFKITKAEHEQSLKAMKESLNETILEYKDGKTFPSIKEITYNDNLSKFSMTVDATAFQNSMDSFATVGLGLSATFYQTFSGIPVGTTIEIIDSQTKELIETIVYPNDIE